MYKDIGAQKFEVIEYTTDELIKFLIYDHVPDRLESNEMFSYDTQDLFHNYFKNDDHIDKSKIFNRLDQYTIDKIIKYRGLEKILNDKDDLILPVFEKYKLLFGYRRTLQNVFLNATFKMYCNFIFNYCSRLIAGYATTSYEPITVLFYDDNNCDNFTLEYSEYIKKYRDRIKVCSFSDALFNCGAGALIICNKGSNHQRHRIFMKNMDNPCNFKFNNSSDNFDEYLVQMKYYCPEIDTNGIWINQYKDCFIVI